MQSEKVQRNATQKQNKSSGTYKERKGEYIVNEDMHSLCLVRRLNNMTKKWGNRAKSKNAQNEKKSKETKIATGETSEMREDN